MTYKSATEVVRLFLAGRLAQCTWNPVTPAGRFAPPTGEFAVVHLTAKQIEWLTGRLVAEDPNYDRRVPEWFDLEDLGLRVEFSYRRVNNRNNPHCGKLTVFRELDPSPSRRDRLPRLHPDKPLTWIYDGDVDYVAFRKTKEAFGGLSNMAAGYPLRVNDIDIRTSEALYQALRFPNRPDIQKKIVAQPSPMAAKMVGKPHRKDFNRPDWDAVRVVAMGWCLRVKLLQNWDKFWALLDSTGDRAIVEHSHRDAFWGAVSEGDALVGRNVLGTHLTALRDAVRGGTLTRADAVEPPAIPDFKLYGEDIGTIRGE